MRIIGGWPAVRARAVVMALVTLATAVVLAACGSSSGSSGGGRDLLAQLRDKKLASGSTLQAPPYNVLEPDGTVTGMVPDVTTRVMKGIGVPEIQWTTGTFDSFIPNLIAGRVDMIAAGLSITEERCKQVLFSDPITADTYVAIVKTGNPKNIRSEQDAGKLGAKVSVITGTADYVKGLQRGIEKENYVVVPDTNAGVANIQSGRADAMFMTGQEAKPLIKGKADLEAVPSTNPDLAMTGIAFRKQDKDLRDAFNKELARLKADGAYEKIAAKWGFDGELGAKAKLQQSVPPVPTCVKER
jgi:polar amino acid transport system substrate-binding protein